MIITWIRWNPDRLDHISKHRVMSQEVEEAAFDDPNRVVEVLKKSRHNRREKVYRLLGRTHTGRYLLFVFIYKGQGVAYPVTARDMDPDERRYYHAKSPL